MAVPDLEKIVKIVFAGDDTDLGKTITSVGGGLDALSSKVAGATEPFAKLSDTIIKIDAVLAGLAVGALVVATKAAGDFGDSFNEIKTLIDPTTLSMEKFRDQILRYAKDSTQSIEQITAGLYSGISAGEDYRTSLELLEAAEKLGIATKASLNTAIEALRPTLSAFGLDTKSAADFADILFQAVKNGKLTLDELAPVLGNVASIAKNAGVPFDDLAAAIAALTAAAGISASEAVTQLKGAILAISAPTDSARDAAEKLEVAIGAEAIAAKGLDGVFRDLVEATGGNIEKLKEIVPRVEALNAVLVLGQDAAGIFDNALGAMEERAGSASIAYDKMADNFELVNQRLINNIKAALIEVGTPLLDDWGELALSIVNILRGIEDDPINWGDVFGPLTALAEELLSDLAGYFNDIAAVLPEALEGIDWTGFTNAIRDLVETGKDLFGQLLGGLDLTSAEDLETAIQKVIDTFENWIKLTEGLVEGLTPFLVKIGELISNFSEMDEATVKSIGEFTGWGKAINSVANFIPNLTGALNLLAGAIGLLSVTRIPALISAFGTVGGVGLAGSVGTLVAAFAPLTALITAFGLASPDEGIGKWLKENSEAFKAFSEWVDKAYLSLAGIDQQQIENLETGGQQKQLLAELAVAVDDWVKSLDDIPEQVPVTIDLALDEAFKDIDDASDLLQSWEDERISKKVNLALDEFFEDVDSVNESLNFGIDAETSKKINLNLDEFFGEVDAAASQLDEKLPPEKILEIKLQGEIDVELAEIKAQADIIQSAFEFSAEVEIANIEAEAEKLIAITDTLQVAWQTTADVITGALGVLSSFEAGTIEWRDIMRIIERELTVRENLAEVTIELTKEQIELTKAKTALISRGQPIINITTDGIEPELEAVLFAIVQKAQIKATEEGLGFLLGTD